ncbi:MAG: hypothetical protein AVDCRST_MAG59-3888, partial [uncultured Thermomicrobiales bacterium]
GERGEGPRGARGGAADRPARQEGDRRGRGGHGACRGRTGRHPIGPGSSGPGPLISRRRQPRRRLRHRCSRGAWL